MTDSLAMLILGAGFLGLLLGLVLYIVYVIGCWKIFTKAGEPGWKSIIPLYNSYIVYRIAGRSKLFIAVVVLTIVNALLPKGDDVSILISLLALLISLALLVISWLKNKSLAEAFGHGTGFAIGLLLIPFVFNIILGFDSSEYTQPVEM